MAPVAVFYIRDFFRDYILHFTWNASNMRVGSRIVDLILSMQLCVCWGTTIYDHFYGDDAKLSTTFLFSSQWLWKFDSNSVNAQVEVQSRTAQDDWETPGTQPGRGRDIFMFHTGAWW